MIFQAGQPAVTRPLGAHASVADGLCQAIDRAERIKATALQIFTRNQLRWHSAPLSRMAVAEFRKRLTASPIQYFCAHAGYLINLASPSEQIRAQSRGALIEELERADALGCHCLVMHPGSPKEDGAAAGVERVVEGLKRGLDATRSLNVRIALENTAGQGSCLGALLEELLDIIVRVDAPQRLGLCLDSAHAFAAGTDLRVPRAVRSLAEQIDSTVGRDRLYLLHLNDSKIDCGRFVDRHQHIGKGFIGDSGFRNLLHEPLLSSIPGIIETPKEGSQWYIFDADNIAHLRELERA